jgi:single-stranded DNA-binding protein
MNKFIAVGRLITEPSYRQAGGVEVCDYKISVRTRGKNDQGYPNSIIVKCTMWRKLAEMAKNFGLYKGQMVGVSGMLDMDVYTDKNNIPRTSLTLDVEDIDFIRTTDMPSQAPARGEADDTTDMPTMVATSDPDCPF